MNQSKKAISCAAIVAGIIAMAAALYMDFMRTGTSFRGGLLIAGAVLLIVGFYLLPTKKHRSIIYVLFLFPLLFAFAVTVLIPFACGIFYSLTDWNGIKYDNFVGFGNYIAMFKSKDYVYSFVVTFIYTVINMLSVNIVAFALALLCTSKVKGRNFYRAAYFIPNLIGGIVLGYIWQLIFNGILEKYGTALALNEWYGFWGLIILVSWQQIGYMMIIYIAGLQSIPGDIIEAAEIDGANKIQTLFKVTIPMMMPSITICMFLSITNGFKLFDQNLSLTAGEPSKMSEMMALNIFNTFYGRTGWEGVGQAKAVIFFAIVVVIGMIQLRATRSKEVQQ